MTTENSRDGGRRRRYAPRHGRQGRSHVVLPAIAGVLAAVIVLTGGYAAFSYTRFSSGITKLDAIPGFSHGGGHGTTEDVDGKAQNILLVGDDERPADATQEELAQLGTSSDGGSKNTDTIIVLHLAADGRSATLISFPRDAWVSIPGHGMGKINSAYSLGSQGSAGAAGGAQTLIQTVQNVSGLSIDHYVQVSLIEFYRIVQVLGPVQVCLNHAVRDRYSDIDLPAGVQQLDPSQALAFVRQRHGLPNGDLDRATRQQYFLTQEAKQILSAGTLLNPVKFTRVLDTVSKSLSADDGLNMTSLAAQMRNLRPADIRSATIPLLGFDTIDGLSVDTVDTAAMPTFIQSLVGAPEAYTTATAATPSSVGVTVLNGRGVPGAAGAATQALAALGFQTGSPGSSTTTRTTVVQYPDGMEAQAKAVVAAVPGAVPVRTSTVSGVTLLLGADGRTVTSAAASAAPAAPAAPAASTAPAGSSAAAAPASSAAAPATPSATPSAASYGTEGSCIN